MEVKDEMLPDRTPLSLFDLSAGVVTSIMGKVEREVWGKQASGTKYFPIKGEGRILLGEALYWDLCMLGNVKIFGNWS